MDRVSVERVYNFGSGPAAIPVEVLEKAKGELTNWHNAAGMSVMEMSHRGAEFTKIAADAERDLRTLLAIPGNYKVLFLQGGASMHFAAVPMNLLRGMKKADYVNTGEWSKKAIAEAKKFCEVNVVASSEDKNFTYAPKQSTWKLSADAAYVHYCSNETIGGVEFQWTPETGKVPLVSDMSSHILSRPVEVSKYGCIYAGAQKNIGPAGLVVVIVREDLIGNVLPGTPTVLDYKKMAEADSMINTPPTFAVYLAGLTFQWLLERGGLAAVEKVNVRKAKLLYDYIDSQDFYSNPIAKEDRSRMNVPFRLRDEKLDAKFLEQAEARGLSQLKGHRSVGGMRASIYNALPYEGVEALVGYMQEFARANG
ncbi:Phosphoserine aminotransferase [Usitatibacter rugosus]|uniref:Phosphoserine aminotransferase n=1 Tax=Usitatibacter rugosus TaxID=2732067 RepID=A0A6M4GYJ3_9PROT|nr:3-phosphoserine/phosphohydroxythreonine transaminase [Usitatibacter rugosus]QJR11564.1 Phosphoserine aminotransferase [Usitatibacter rugosus]